MPASRMKTLSCVQALYACRVRRNLQLLLAPVGGVPTDAALTLDACHGEPGLQKHTS